MPRTIACQAPLSVGFSRHEYWSGLSCPPPGDLPDARDTRGLGLIPGSGRSPGGGNGNLLQYPCLENSKDRGTCQATVCGVAESDTTEHACMHTHTASSSVSRGIPGFPVVDPTGTQATIKVWDIARSIGSQPNYLIQEPGTLGTLSRPDWVIFSSQTLTH